MKQKTTKTKPTFRQRSRSIEPLISQSRHADSKLVAVARHAVNDCAMLNVGNRIQHSLFSVSKTKLETLKSQTLEKAITRPRKACLFHLSSTEPQMISRFLTSHSTLRVPSAIREPVHDLENLVMRNVCLHHARNQFERKLFMSQ